MPPFHVIVTDHMPGPYHLEEEAMEGIARVVGLGARGECGLDDRLADADALFVYHEATITPAVVARLRRCKVIARCGVGYDNVDVRACGEAGIVVCNVPDYGVEEVAEHAMALLLAVWRKIPLQDGGVRAGMWDCHRPAPVRRL
ncbi:MAG: C-terminal binding protein, partial [Armatimonadota bacterium]|nr:C-terminal binding protein [Armatimonadota bacterium]